jgi:hypothetical protein
VDRTGLSIVSVRIQEAVLMPTIQRASLILASLLVTGVLPLTHARAASTTLGPTVCVRAGVNGLSGTGLIYDYNGVTVATGTGGGPVDIVCTLFRDNTSNSNGMQDLEMSVFDPTTGSIFCDAMSLDRKGIQKKISRRQTSVTGESVLDWGGSVNVSVSKGFYSIRCQVPNGGAIRSIYYVEP